MVTKPELIRQNAQKDQHIRQLLDIVEKQAATPMVASLETNVEPVTKFGTSQSFVGEQVDGFGNKVASSLTPASINYDDDDDFEGEKLDLEDLIDSLRVPYADDACVAIGAVVLMLENKIEFLPVKTGADLGTYGEQAEVIHKLRTFLALSLNNADGNPLDDVAEAAFWAEATGLYESLTS